MRVSFGKLSPRLGIPVLVVVILVASALGVHSLRSRPPRPTTVSIGLGKVEAGAPSPSQMAPLAREVVVSCASVYLPGPDTEVNAIIDPESKRIQISWWDSRLGGNQVVTISYEDPTCGYDPEMKKLVANVLGVLAEQTERTCAAFAEAVRKNDPTINLEGAKRYIERWCR